MKKIKPRERVLKTASKLFIEQGFNSTGVNQIIKESNVAKASFYDHFKSKDLLGVEYLNKRHIEWFNGLTDFVSSYDKPKEKILNAFEYLKYMNEQENFGGCVFLNMLSELKYENKTSYEIIKNHKMDLQAFFEEIIKDEHKSFIIYMLFESCLVESQVYRSQDIINKTIQYLKSGIL